MMSQYSEKMKANLTAVSSLEQVVSGCLSSTGPCEVSTSLGNWG